MTIAMRHRTSITFARLISSSPSLSSSFSEVRSPRPTPRLHAKGISCSGRIRTIAARPAVRADVIQKDAAQWWGWVGSKMVLGSQTAPHGETRRHTESRSFPSRYAYNLRWFRLCVCSVLLRVWKHSDCNIVERIEQLPCSGSAKNVRFCEEENRSGSESALGEMESGKGGDCDPTVRSIANGFFGRFLAGDLSECCFQDPFFPSQS